METARQSMATEEEDRQIDLVIRELEKYKVVAAALQETEWFGNKAYTVGESIVVSWPTNTPS